MLSASFTQANVDVYFQLSFSWGLAVARLMLQAP